MVYSLEFSDLPAKNASNPIKRKCKGKAQLGTGARCVMSSEIFQIPLGIFAHLWDTVGNPAGQDIQNILPTKVANHSVGLGLSSMLIELAIKLILFNTTSSHCTTHLLNSNTIIQRPFAGSSTSFPL